MMTQYNKDSKEVRAGGRVPYLQRRCCQAQGRQANGSVNLETQVLTSEAHVLPVPFGEDGSSAGVGGGGGGGGIPPPCPCDACLAAIFSVGQVGPVGESLLS